MTLLILITRAHAQYYFVLWLWLNKLSENSVLVELVVRPSTKEAFAITVIENGRDYLAKQSHLASAYHGFLSGREGGGGT